MNASCLLGFEVVLDDMLTTQKRICGECKLNSMELIVCLLSVVLICNKEGYKYHQTQLMCTL
jgi:hypothetical protein